MHGRNLERILFAEIAKKKWQQIEEIKREWGRRANDNTTPRQKYTLLQACLLKAYNILRSFIQRKY
jgi:hypothetical protein